MKEKAKKLRKELKKEGWTSKDISVRSSSGNLSVKIKNTNINIEIVEKIAKKYESVSYCEQTQEILSGGNDFVSISYDWESMKTAREKYINFAKAIIKQDENIKYLDKIYENENIEILYWSQHNSSIPKITVEDKNKKNSTIYENQYCANSYQILAESFVRVAAKYNISDIV